MAKFYITEFTKAASSGDIGGLVPIAQVPSITTQVITHTGSSVQSAGFDANTRFIRVHTDGICHIVVGDNPTATTSNMRMSADQTEYFGVRPGQKLAVITGA